MAYCTSGDLTKAGISASIIISLTDDERLATTSTTLAAAIALNSLIEDRIDEAIAQADGLIDAYVREQYDVPIAATVPQIVKTLSVDLAIFYLHKRRRSELGVPEEIRITYKEAIHQLEGINSGKIDVGAEPEPATSDLQKATASSETAVFTADTLKDF